MKISFVPLALPLLVCILLFSACHSPKDLEFREFKNLRLQKLGFSSTQLKVDLVYYNPNNMSLELNRTDLDVYLGNTYFGHSAQNVQVKIPNRKLFIVPLVVDVDMKNLLKNSLTTLLKKEVTIRVVGKIRIGKAGVFKTFPLDYQTVQQVPAFEL